MIKKIIFSFVFTTSFGLWFSQTKLEIKNNCDTLFIVSAKEQVIKMEKAQCLNSPNGGYLFTKENEYVDFYKRKQSGHSNCGEKGLNFFDFQKYDVLYIGLGLGGCSEPEIKIRTYDVNRELVVYIKIKTKGMCDMLHHFHTYLLIEKNTYNKTPKIIKCFK